MGSNKDRHVQELEIVMLTGFGLIYALYPKNQRITLYIIFYDVCRIDVNLPQLISSIDYVSLNQD
jgi:hypothetical protein